MGVLLSPGDFLPPSSTFAEWHTPILRKCFSETRTHTCVRQPEALAAPCLSLLSTSPSSFVLSLAADVPPAVGFRPQAGTLKKRDGKQLSLWLLQCGESTGAPCDTV